MTFLNLSKAVKSFHTDSREFCMVQYQTQNIVDCQWAHIPYAIILKSPWNEYYHLISKVITGLLTKQYIKIPICRLI